ncbi:MAG: ester cyclase [Ignavibacteriales bacterium]|nr:ester cyclase [Ignavibacteriales bacterium]
MSASDKKLIIREYVANVINTGNVGEIEKYVSADYTEVSEGKRYPIGPAEAKEHILGVRQTYPDLAVTVEQQIADGEYVASCITARGTHLGVWLGIKPTGKVVTYTGVNIDWVVDGRITEHGGAANLLGPLLEIGAVRVVGHGDSK